MTRSDKRLQALGYILSDGLTYDWFRVLALDVDKVTARVMVNTGDADEDGKEEWVVKDVTADDVARGLRMYAEYLEGTREAFPGEFKYRAKDAVRAGLIASEDEFVPGEHNRAAPQSYGRQTVLFDRTNGDEGDYDANTADCVMQFALLGYTVFG